MSLRRRGKIISFLKFVGVLLLGVLMGAGTGFGFHMYKMASIEEVKPVPKQTVITVSHPVKLGDVITEEDIVEMEVEEERIPLGSFTQKEEVLGKKAWTRLEPKVVLNQDLFYSENIDFMQNLQEVTLVKLPENLEIGDYIDLRIQFPSGHDYCVLSHKQVGSKNIELNQITLGLNEEERVRLGSAKTDALTFDNTYLYLTIYPKGVEMPNTAVRYPVSGSVQKLYEEVTGGLVIGQERNQLELALNQLKEDAKFLKLVSEKADAPSADKESLDIEDKNLAAKLDTAEKAKTQETQETSKSQKEKKDGQAAAEKSAEPKEGESPEIKGKEGAASTDKTSSSTKDKKKESAKTENEF